MVDDVCAAHVYEQSATTDYRVAVKVGYGPVGLTTCLHHVYSAELSQLTWTLDEARPSSFRTNDGFWVVRPLAEDPSACTVYYSIAVEVKGWVPSWVNGFVAQQGIPRAVSWLKKEAEARYCAAQQQRQAAQATQAAQASTPRASHGAGTAAACGDPQDLLAKLPLWLRGCFGVIIANTARPAAAAA